MLTDPTAFESNPFADPLKTDPYVDQRETVDVSLAAMSRLRTPFGVDADADRQTGNSARTANRE